MVDHKIIPAEQKNVKIARPDIRKTVVVGGEPREILMSSGMLRTLATHVPSIEEIGHLFLDGVQQEIVLCTLLAERDDNGRLVTSNLRLDDFDISEDDCEELITWVGEHLHAFFINMGMRYAIVLKPVVEHLEGQKQSSSGTKD